MRADLPDKSWFLFMSSREIWCMCVYIIIHIYIYVYTCVYIYIHIHIHLQYRPACRVPPATWVVASVEKRILTSCGCWATTDVETDDAVK